MSLINDALKRANAARPPQLTGEEHVPPMRPVPGNSVAVIWPLILAPIVLLVVLMMAIWFLWRGWEASRQTHAQVAQPAVAAREPAAPSTPSPVPSALPVPIVAAEENAAESSLPPAVPETPAQVPPAPRAPTPALPTTAAVAAAPAPPIKQTPLKLQGIFYRPRKPAVVINGKSLFIGESIENVTVIAIDRSSATVVQAGRTNVLTLH